MEFPKAKDGQSRQTIEKDIAQGTSYLLCENDTPIATFALLAGPEPTYSYIEGGRWLDDQPYYVIHRVASVEGVHGVMSDIIAYCLSLTSTIRIDTHADNYPMQAVLKRSGFNYCGIIYLEDGSQRQAYQLSLQALLSLDDQLIILLLMVLHKITKAL